jgi:hypothetical protein
MVGVAIGFVSTTAFPAVERLSENGKGRTNKECRCAGMRFAKLGQRKPSDPTEVPKAFEAYTSLLQDLKKGFQ